MTQQRRTSRATAATGRGIAPRVRTRGAARAFAIGLGVAAMMLLARAGGASEGFGPLYQQASPVVVADGGPPQVRESRPLMPAPASRPSGGQGSGAGEMVAKEAPRTAGALIAVLAIAAGLFLGLRAIAKRTGGFAAMLGPGGRAPAGVLEVLGRYPVGRGQTLVLLKLDRRVLLVSQTGGGRFGGGGFQTLCELNEPDDVASILRKTRDESSESMSSRFQQMLKAFDRGHESRNVDPTRIVTSIAPEPMRVRPARAPEPVVGSGAGSMMTGRDAAAALRSRLDALRQAEADSVELSQASRLREVRA